MKIEICHQTRDAIGYVAAAVAAVFILTSMGSCAKGIGEQTSKERIARYQAGIVEGNERK